MITYEKLSKVITSSDKLGDPVVKFPRTSFFLTLKNFSFHSKNEKSLRKKQEKEKTTRKIESFSKKIKGKNENSKKKRKDTEVKNKITKLKKFSNNYHKLGMITYDNL